MSTIRRSHAFALLLPLIGLAVSAASQAAPTIGTAKPALTIDPKSRPHVVAARTRLGENGLPVTVAGGAALPFDVDVKNPTNADVRVTILQDATGAYPVTVPANSTKTFGVASAIAVAACTENPSRSVWLQENDDVKVKIKVEANCLLRATAPALGVMQPAPGKIMYSAARVKTAPRTCADDLMVEANVTNGSNAPVNARLTLPALGRMNEFTLAAGQTKTVAVGGSMAGKSDGRKVLHLIDNDNLQNPAVVAGEWGADVTSTCRPTITVLP